jgi:hypothetical protein
MHRNRQYQIPKALRQVTLWIHQEGRVIGSLFLSLHTKSGAGLEDPFDALHEPTPFLALQCTAPHGLRFYNKQAIVRVEYQEEEASSWESATMLCCQLSMMDGSRLEGTVRHPLPPSRARLYDYLNMTEERFAKLYMEDGSVCLVNKSYIVCVSPLDDRCEPELQRLTAAVGLDETYA